MNLPQGFVYLNDLDPTIVLDLKYLTHDNFIGRPVKGYEAPVCILTREAALALVKVQQRLKQQSCSLKVFDAFRPQTAVDDLVNWCLDVSDQKTKLDYFPRVNKADFFELHYLAKKSSHTRGSTVDVTILRQGEELDMGSPFDFMDKLSHPHSELIQGDARRNRLWLRELMVDAGFVPLETEWWHFTLKNEPFPDTYFDFPIR